MDVKLTNNIFKCTNHSNNMIVVGFKKISEEICQSVVFYTMERILKSRTGAGFRLTSLTGLDLPNYLLTNQLSELSINFLEVYLVAT